jgi:hypothetical protein
MKWVPYPAGSSPIDLTQAPTIREYCRVERFGDSDTQLGNRNCSGFKCAAAIQAATAPRVCSVSSNWTGRCALFFWHENGTAGDVTALDHIVDTKPHQIASPQLAVDGEVEQREFPDPMPGGNALALLGGARCLMPIMRHGGDVRRDCFNPRQSRPGDRTGGQ